MVGRGVKRRAWERPGGAGAKGARYWPLGGFEDKGDIRKEGGKWAAATYDGGQCRNCGLA